MGAKERARAKKRKQAVSTKQERRGQTADRRGSAGGEKKAILPFAAGQRALLVGEGDFSFSCAMTQLLVGQLDGVVTTTLDSQKETRKKYPRSKRYTDQLRKRGAKVTYGVDATKAKALAACDANGGFDRIVFQFPHSGQQRVHVNRALLRDFFEAAVGVLAPGGLVVVTLKERRPYTGWLLEEQAAQVGFKPTRSVPFDPKQYPGYRHVTTEAEAAVDGTHGFEVVFAKSTYFALSAAAQLERRQQPSAKAAAADAEDESEDESEDGSEDDSEDEVAQPSTKRAKTAAVEMITFDDTDGSDLDEEDSSGDESFVAQMLKRQNKAATATDASASSASTSSPVAANDYDEHSMIEFEDTDGSDLDEEDLSDGDESFIEKMQRKHRAASKPAAVAPNSETAHMTEEERHDAMLDAARVKVRARRETAAAAATAAQAAVPKAATELVQPPVPAERVSSAVEASTAGSSASAAASGKSYAGAGLRVGSRVRCLYPSDGGRYPATILQMRGPEGAIVKWDDGDAQHTERPMQEVWPLTESESESEQDEDDTQEKAQQQTSAADADAVVAVDARAYIKAGRRVPDKEKAVLLQKLRRAGRAAVVGTPPAGAKAARAGGKAHAGARWPVPGQALRLSGSKRKAVPGAVGGSAAAPGERGTKRRKKRRGVVVEQTIA